MLLPAATAAVRPAAKGGTYGPLACSAAPPGATSASTEGETYPPCPAAEGPTPSRSRKRCVFAAMLARVLVRRLGRAKGEELMLGQGEGWEREYPSWRSESAGLRTLLDRRERLRECFAVALAVERGGKVGRPRWEDCVVGWVSVVKEGRWWGAEEVGCVVAVGDEVDWRGVPSVVMICGRMTGERGLVLE